MSSKETTKTNNVFRYSICIAATLFILKIVAYVSVLFFGLSTSDAGALAFVVAFVSGVAALKVSVKSD